MIEQLLFEFFLGVGATAFAISGAFKAIRHELDVLGVLVLGFVTALGGGLVRDALLHTTPAAFLDLGPAMYAMTGCVIAIMANAVFKDLILPLARPEGRVFLVLDAIGLAAFTVLGARLATEAGLNIFGIVLLAAITGVLGGMFRDVMVMEVPLVLKADFYATATIIGAVLFAVLYWLGFAMTAISAATFAVTLLLRLIAIWRRWHLPVVGREFKQ